MMTIANSQIRYITINKNVHIVHWLLLFMRKINNETIMNYKLGIYKLVKYAIKLGT